MSLFDLDASIFIDAIIDKYHEKNGYSEDYDSICVYAIDELRLFMTDKLTIISTVDLDIDPRNDISPRGCRFDRDDKILVAKIPCQDDDRGYVLVIDQPGDLALWDFIGLCGRHFQVSYIG